MGVPLGAGPLVLDQRFEVPQLGRDVEQTTIMLDYRDVDGVKLPHHLRVTSAIQNFTITCRTAV